MRPPRHARPQINIANQSPLFPVGVDAIDPASITSAPSLIQSSRTKQACLTERKPISTDRCILLRITSWIIADKHNGQSGRKAPLREGLYCISQLILEFAATAVPSTRVVTLALATCVSATAHRKVIVRSPWIRIRVSAWNLTARERTGASTLLPLAGRYSGVSEWCTCKIPFSWHDGHPHERAGQLHSYGGIGAQWPGNGDVERMAGASSCGFICRLQIRDR